MNINDKKVLIIIPCYNEEDNIERVVGNIINNYPQYDYLIVNDCSKDHTEEICKENHYNYVSLCTNLGIGGGVQTGYQYAVRNDYDVAIQIDGDGQHNPDYIEKLVQELFENHMDMVIGSRFIENQGFQSSFSRRFGIKIINGTIALCCGAKVTDATSGFRVCGKEMTRFFAQNYAQDYPEPEAIVSAVLNGYKVGEMPVVMNERVGGESSINGLKSMYYMLKVITALLLQRLSIRRGKKNGR